MSFQEKLKAVYRRHNKIAPLIEGLEEEIPQQTLDDYYVKLNIIIKQDDDKKQGNYEKISGKKQEVEIANIFDQITSKTEPHRLLILGGAGVGKSTLMQYMAYRWSRGDLWAEKFDYVYRITLKTLLNDEWKENYEIKDRKADTLKCLAHYHLVAGLDDTKDLKLEDLVWLEKKEKVLLLLDGYDEVAHERDGIYKDVFTKIFQHENLILTSRPNAIHKEMAEKFGREIENTGLDHDGINQYLTQYFRNDKEKGAELQEFLRKNSSIKDICRIPVNIAMMCFIWSEGEADETAQKISNVSDLYSQVVNQLGFRYDTKQNNQNRDELLSKWRGGEIYLDELQVLQHVAYKGMTGGGFEVPEDKRTETLIIKGMTKKGDKDGISIQSSILYLQEKLKRNMPAINRIYKYGLLKPDGSSVKGQAETSAVKEKEPSDTDLLAQSFNFIHLSFQEFLTAFYFVKKLLKEDSKEEQEKVGNFIAYHRNEPRYLMTLKFMAGILSSCEYDEANEKIHIFWDAVLCNPDGVLELGVEAKVTLLMHLIGQTRNETRVPNMSLAVDFIESVVLRNISEWSTQIKESDYLSENMKEGLIEYFLKDNKEWLEKKYKEMRSKFVKINEHPTSSINIEEMIEIIVSMIHKFTKEQQIQIFQKLFKFLQAENNQTSWQALKKAIEGVVKIQEKVEINLNNIEKRKVLDALKKTVHDRNLGKVSFEAIQQVLNDPDDPLFTEVLKGMIEETPKDLNGVGVYKTVLGGVVQIAQRNLRHKEAHHVLKNIVNVLAPLLSSSQNFVREVVAPTILELIYLLDGEEKEFVREIIGVYISLWQSLPKQKGLIQTNIVELAKVGNNEFLSHIAKDLDSFIRGCSEATLKQRALDTMMEVIKLGKPSSDSQFFREIIVSLLIPLLDEGGEDVCFVVSSEIPQIARIADGNDPQVARDIIKTLLPSLQDDRVKDTVARMIYELAIIRDTKDEGFIRDLIQTFLLSFKDELRSNISEYICELIKASDVKDPQFIQEVITNFAPSLKSTSDTTRLFQAEKIVGLMERGGIRDAQLVRDIVNLAVLVSPNTHVEYLMRTAKVATEAIKVAKITDALARDIVTSISGCFKNWFNDARHVFINPLLWLMNIKSILADTQFVKDFIVNTLYFEVFDDVAYKNLGELITQSGAIKDTQFVRDLLILLTSLIERNQISPSVIPSFEGFVKKLDENCEIELARDIIKALAQILTFSIIRFQPSAEKLMIGIVKKRGVSSPSLLRDVMMALVPVFETPSESILRFGLNIVQEILKIDGITNDKSFIQDCIYILTPIFQAPVTEAKLSALHIIKKLLDKKERSIDDSIIQDLIEALVANLGDKNEDLRKLASTTILNIAKTPQLAVHAVASSVVLKDTSQITDFFLSELIQEKGVVNLELVRESINELAISIQSPRLDIRRSASQRILELVKISKKEKDEEFCKDIVDKIWVADLQASDENTQVLSLDFISKLVDSEGLVKHVVPLVAPLLSGDNVKENTKKSAFTHLLNITKKGGAEFAQDVLKNTLIPLLQITEDENWRCLVLQNIGDLAKAIGKINPEIAKSVTPILFLLLKSNSYSILSSASASLIDLIKACRPTDIQYTRSLVNDLVVLMQEISGDDAKRCILDTIGLLVKSIDTPDLDFMRKVIVDILIPYLHDEDLTSSAASWIPEIVGIAVKSDTQITRDIVKILLPLLQDEKVKHSASTAIYKIVLKYDSKDKQYVREMIDTFFLYLKNDQHMLDIRTSSNIIDITKASDIKDSQFFQDVITNFAPSLKSSGDTTRFIEAEKIVWLMERGGIRDAQLVRDIVNLAVLVPPTIHVEYLINS